MKICQGGSIDGKKFFLIKMTLKDEKMDFPPFSKKKKNFKLAHKKSVKGSMTKKNFFLLEMNLEYKKMDFPLFLKKKIFFKIDIKIHKGGVLA